MRVRQCLRPLTISAVMLFCGAALGQAGQPGQHPTQVGQPRMLDAKAQQAIANLHALNQARSSYSRVAADVASDDQVREFFKQRHVDYEKNDARLGAFALTYGVDVNSPQMEEKTKKTQMAWEKENKKISKAEGDKAAKMALSTFIDRNESAIKDLRTLRGDVQEPQLVTMINERIGSLEQESTKAQALRRMVEQQEKAKKEK